MRRLAGGAYPLIALVTALAVATPAFAQDGAADARLRRLEAEVRDLKRQDGGGRTIAPQALPAAPTTRVPGTPATTPVSDLLIRMETVEAQLARLTAQNEENGNKLRLLEERVAASEAATKAAATTEVTVPAAASGEPSAASGATPSASTRPATRPTAPSAQRVAAVRAVVKPQTDDAGEDEYTYGFRLWEAKFYPEAQQQLKLFIEKHPRHARMTYARNLIGRALLDEGKPRDAASWFLQNFQANKQGARAPDSLLFLAESMTRLKDTSRACIALAEFADTYPQEAAGRLKSQYDATRGTVKCN